jgi:hypothetical protein
MTDISEPELFAWFRTYVANNSNNPFAPTIIAMVGDNYLQYRQYFPNTKNKKNFLDDMLKFCGLSEYDKFSPQHRTFLDRLVDIIMNKLA